MSVRNKSFQRSKLARFSFQFETFARTSAMIWTVSSRQWRVIHISLAFIQRHMPRALVFKINVPSFLLRIPLVRPVCLYVNRGGPCAHATTRATLPREPTILLTSSLNASHSSHFYLSRVICIFGYLRLTLVRFVRYKARGKRET